jgi:hypothetical protein
LELNRTPQLLVCADDVNTLDENMTTTKDALFDAKMEVGLDVSAEKSK